MSTQMNAWIIMSRHKIVTLVVLVLMSCTAYGQSGQADVQFLIDRIDCDSAKLFVDIEVRASDVSSGFNMSDQNYRFYFEPTELANPTIVAEGVVSGFVSEQGTMSFYGTHNLTGSIDSVVSYNVELSGGDGYPINEDWLLVGTMSFDIISTDGCVDLYWNPYNVFPPTFIGEKVNNSLFEVTYNSYTNSQFCIDEQCDDGGTIEGIPTLSEWGMIMLFLLAVSIGTASLKTRIQLSLATNAQQESSWTDFPINRKRYQYWLFILIGGSWLICSIMPLFVGAMTLLDFTGVTLSMVVVAYIVHLLE